MPFGIVNGIVCRTGPGMRKMVGFGERSTGRRTFGGEFGARHCNSGDFTADMCDSVTTRPSSQITLGKLIIIMRDVLWVSCLNII